MLKFLVLLSYLIINQDTPTTIPKKESGPRFPTVSIPVVPTPVPIPAPPPVQDAPLDSPVLSPGEIYIIESDFPFFVLEFPLDSVKITPETGPLKVAGAFFGGNGKFERRTIDAKYVAFIDPITPDVVVNLAAIREGDSTRENTIRTSIRTGKGSRPPPGPVVPVVPIPDPVNPPIPTATGFRVIFVYEVMAANTREMLNTLHSTQITAFLNQNCTKGPDGKTPEWRRWDKDIKLAANETPAIAGLWNSIQPELAKVDIAKTPQIAIAVNGVAKVYDIPPTEALTLDLLKREFAGVK